MKQIAFLPICLLLSFPAFTQNATNPVQVTSNLIPPYSLYLSDYNDGSQNKWNIQLLLKDFTQTNYQAKLRITIEGAGVRLRTRKGFSPGPIRLDPGIPYQVGATDLSQYLNIQNMEVSGINRNQLASTQKLPEGFYQFKIEVLDYNRNNRVSNTGTSMAWLVLNDPPLLNLPFEEKLRIQDPQQVQFQWTPRHTSSPNSAFETEYIFKLWEIWPEGRDPNEVARTTQPLFERTIMTTSYFYGLNDAMLIPGRSYAWQVKAINLNGRDLFKNQGRSEVRWFKYGDECLPITNLGAEALGTDRIRITWEGKWNHNQYVAQIREKGEEGWINYGTNIETQVVYDLKASTEYQIRVLPSCGAIEGTAENTLTLTTLEQEPNDMNCGAEPDLPTIENREPIAQLSPGDRITAAGFTVILTEVIKTGNTYTGMGLIEVPLFNSARVEAVLNNIKVNTDKQLIGGNVESTLNPNGPFILDTDIDEELSEEGGNGEENNDDEEEIDELPDTDIEIGGEIADVEYEEEEGTITVIDTEGNTTDIDPETADENGDDNVVIEDGKGNVWVVGDDGEVSGPHNSGGETGGEEYNSDEIWFEYEDLQYQSGTEINLSDNVSSHLITLIDNSDEEDLIWSAFNGDEDITDEIFLDNPTDTDSASIILQNDIAELELNIRIGEADYSIRLINNNDNTEEPIAGISRNPELLVINELTSSFTSSEERLELTYTYLDSLELNNSKIEILKINEQDTTLVIFYDDIEKGEDIVFIDTHDEISGWSGKGTDNNFVEEGDYLLRITVSVDDSFDNGFEDYETFIVNESESSDEVYDYFVTDDDAWYREKESPYNVITPEPRTNILPKGFQVTVLEIVQDEEGNEVAKMKLKETEEIEYTTLSNLKRVQVLSENKKYKLLESFTAHISPASSEKADKTYLTDEEIISNKKFGSFFKVKDIGEPILGHWINASLLRSEFFATIFDLINGEETMTTSEIAGIRNQIKELDIEEEQGDLYIELQSVVPYKDQRDNEAPATEEDLSSHPWMSTYNISTAGEIMCNLTSQAMSLSFLGVDKPCSGCSEDCLSTYDQMEDYLECIRVDENYDVRTEGSTREELAELFDVEYQYINLQGKSKEGTKSLLLSPLRNGESVMLGGFGHMVRLQSLSDEGVIVDDPYGKIVNFTASGVTAKYKKDGKDYRNGKDFGDNVGENNFWTWDEFMNKLNVKYGEAYSKD